MKATIAYALALLIMVHGENGTRRASQRKVISHRGNPYEHLLPAGGDGQMCMPGSKFEGVCRKCFCSQDGTEVICTNEVCPDLPRHRRDIPSIEPIRIRPNKSCTICSCDYVINGLRFCAMVYYEDCPQ